jgi:hypothetical protein
MHPRTNTNRCADHEVISKFSGNIDAIPDAIVCLTCGPSNCRDSSNRNYARANNHNGRASKPACELPTRRQ